MHHPRGQFCFITAVFADTVAARTARATVTIQGGWGNPPVLSANGKFVHSFSCTTITDVELVKLKALVGVTVTENTDPTWPTRSAFTLRRLAP
jgi:hypothetical protein